MVKLVPITVAPHYCGRWVCYLPTEVAVPLVVPWISFSDE